MTIKEICQNYGISQTELSRSLGIPLRTVQQWYAGDRTPPDYVVEMIYCVLSLKKETLLKKTKESQAPELDKGSADNEHPSEATIITVKAPDDVDCGVKQWPAKYTSLGTGEARMVRIAARSSIDIVVAKVTEKGFLGAQTSYYISSPNFAVAIPGISSLQEDFWIMEQLINNGMPGPDAVTVAQVLRNMGDF